MRRIRNFKNNIRTLPKKEKGFTLLEVIIAISIFTIGLLAIAMLQGSAVRGTNSARTFTIAATLAGDRMEKLLALEKDSPQLEDTDNDGTSGLSDIGNDADHALTNQVISGKSFDIFWNTAPDTPKTGNKTISLIISWSDQGRGKQLELRQVK